MAFRIRALRWPALVVCFCLHDHVAAIFSSCCPSTAGCCCLRLALLVVGCCRRLVLSRDGRAPSDAAARAWLQGAHQASAAPRVYTAVLYTQQLGFIAAPPLGASWRGTLGRAAVGFLCLRGKFPDRQDGLEAAGLGRLRHARPRRLGAPIKSSHVSHDNFR